MTDSATGKTIISKSYYEFRAVEWAKTIKEHFGASAHAADAPKPNTLENRLMAGQQGTH